MNAVTTVTKIKIIKAVPTVKTDCTIKINQIPHATPEISRNIAKKNFLEKKFRTPYKIYYNRNTNKNSSINNY